MNLHKNRDNSERKYENEKVSVDAVCVQLSLGFGALDERVSSDPRINNYEFAEKAHDAFDFTEQESPADGLASLEKSERTEGERDVHQLAIYIVRNVLEDLNLHGTDMSWNEFLQHASENASVLSVVERNPTLSQEAFDLIEVSFAAEILIDPDQSQEAFLDSLTEDDETKPETLLVAGKLKTYRNQVFVALSGKK